MINKVSENTKEAIKRKSAYSLPNRPSEQGMKPDEIKQAFYKPIVDSQFSTLTELDRVVDEVNDEFDNLPAVAKSGKLSDATEDSSHRTVSDTEKSTWNGKQDSISDLSTIRSGAGAGATALQPGAIGDSVQAQLSSSQLDAVNSGIDSTKVGKLAELSKPNLLVNGDFQVNQRGQSSYTILTDKNTYTVDRWYGNRLSSFTVNSNKSITINGSLSWGIFGQIIDNFENFKGKKLTLSVKISSFLSTSGNPKISLRDGVGATTASITSTGILSVTRTINENATTLEARPYYNDYDGVSDTNITIDWAKLELGEVATPFNSKSYAEELAACQMPFDSNGISTTYSNPNLIINGDFRVNQRGETTYTAINGSVYTADRWILNYMVGSTFTPSTKTLSVAANGSFYQYIEDTPALLGKTVTISAKVNGIIYSATVDITSSYSENDAYIKDIKMSKGKIRLLYSISKNVLRIGITEDQSQTYNLVIDYIKLEVGEAATPYSPRLYAEELALCQRYYYLLKPRGHFALVRGTGDLRLVGHFPVTMYKNPTAKQLKVVTVYGDNFTSSYTQTAIGFQITHCGKNGYLLGFKNWGSALPTGCVGMINTDNDDDIVSFDAEI